REVKKSYIAIVRGRMHRDAGTFAFPMGPASEGLHVLMCVTPTGDSAITDYQVIERRGEYTMVRLEPQTGRQHQLRVHLSHAGHSIVGDKLYGPEGPKIFSEFVENGMTLDLEARLGHSRQALHAAQLRFRHPRTEEELVVEAPFPPDLEELWRNLTRPERAWHSPRILE